jgi:chemotaxis protein methyltransferase CheR
VAEESITITDEELKSLTDAIQKRHGIDFSCYEQKSLKRRIIRSLHVFKFNGIHELWIRILKDHGFIYPFMDEISVGLTSMFRDPVLWKKLRYLLQTNFFPNSNITIWHAGCSTGEEVYSMGIVLRETNAGKQAKAFATDISNQAIATAQAGKYHILKLDEYNNNYREFNSAGSLNKYYRANENEGAMDTSLISHVNFEYHNLITGIFNRKYDIIFCRNVMIYFDNDAKKKLFERFYDSLNKNGLLIIGFYDAVLPMLDASKFSIYDMDAKIFQKRS